MYLLHLLDWAYKSKINQIVLKCFIRITYIMKLLLAVKMAAGMDVRDILELEGPEQQFITKDALMNDKKVQI